MIMNFELRKEKLGFSNLSLKSGIHKHDYKLNAVNKYYFEQQR